MHSHEHHHLAGAESIEELIKLMEFTLRHNASHTDELSALAGQLEQYGKSISSQKVLSALEEYKKGNALLEEALKAIE
ncbi:MAG: hypothetical protein K5761_07950 [Clostridiales bacterium]|nr:hypothetical protein [Clostridiales bacterium]